MFKYGISYKILSNVTTAYAKKTGLYSISDPRRLNKSGKRIQCSHNMLNHNFFLLYKIQQNAHKKI